jgi:hypothetical protein
VSPVPPVTLNEPGNFVLPSGWAWITLVMFALLVPRVA